MAALAEKPERGADWYRQKITVDNAVTVQFETHRPMTKCIISKIGQVAVGTATQFKWGANFTAQITETMDLTATPCIVPAMTGCPTHFAITGGVTDDDVQVEVLLME